MFDSTRKNKLTKTYYKIFIKYTYTNYCEVAVYKKNMYNKNLVSHALTLNLLLLLLLHTFKFLLYREYKNTSF